MSAMFSSSAVASTFTHYNQYRIMIHIASHHFIDNYSILLYKCTIEYSSIFYKILSSVITEMRMRVSNARDMEFR